jgi:hypothetical protein
LFKLIPQGGCWVNLPEDLQKEYLQKSYFSGGGKRGILYRLSMNLPSLTLLCTPSQKQTERCHPLEERPLNILEYAKIQTFDDDYLFYGNTTSKYKQIGNAVPVKLAEHMGAALFNYFTTHFCKLQEYYAIIDPLICSVMNRKVREAITYDILDSDVDLLAMQAVLRVKQRQMKYGEIWQIIIGNYSHFENGNYYHFENLGVGHITGLDVISRDKKVIFEIKNRYNTDNASSRKANYDKLVKFKKEHLDYDIVYGVINEKGKIGIQKNIEYDGQIIKYLSGDKLFDYVFGENATLIIAHVKELMSNI